MFSRVGSWRVQVFLQGSNSQSDQLEWNSGDAVERILLAERRLATFRGQKNTACVFTPRAAEPTRAPFRTGFMFY